MSQWITLIRNLSPWRKYRFVTTEGGYTHSTHRGEMLYCGCKGTTTFRILKFIYCFHSYIAIKEETKSMPHNMCTYFIVFPWNTLSKYPSVRTIPEALLTRCIPYLELYAFPWLNLNQAREEIHTNCRVRHLGKPSLCEAPNQTWFTNRGVTDDDQAKLVKPYRLHVYLRKSIR